MGSEWENPTSFPTVWDGNRKTQRSIPVVLDPNGKFQILFPRFGTRGGNKEKSLKYNLYLTIMIFV